MKKILLALFVCFFSISTFAKDLYFASVPALSPDAKTIYFSYDGDIFKVAVEGGMATRVISMGGVESNPKISPNGRYIAFSSNVQGNNNLYIVPVNGGTIKQLTWDAGNDIPVSWSPDSQYIYFESGRYNPRTTFRVSIEGGTPERLFDNYFNTVVQFVVNPKTGEYLFNEASESFNSAHRKGYKGENNPAIRSWNPANRSFKELTSYEGKNMWPMVDKDGNIFYMSDVSGHYNIAKMEGPEPKMLTKFDESAYDPGISYNGEKIVFTKGYKITTYDIASGDISVPHIHIADNAIEERTSFDGTAPDYAAISPDGKKFAFSKRGLLFVTGVKGDYVEQIPTPVQERVMQVEWGADNKTIYYIRTDKGWYNLFKTAADKSSGEQPVYRSQGNISAMTLSNKRDKIAIIDGNRDVAIINCQDSKAEKVASGEFWSFQGYSLNWSADDKFITFNAMNLFERDIYIYSLQDKRLTNLTNSATSENGPIFSPDGKYLFATASRYAPSFPRGGGASTLFKIALNDKTPVSFKSEKYEELFTKAAKGDSTIIIKPEGVHKRFTPVVNGGSQYGQYLFKTKDKAYLLFFSTHDGPRSLYSLELDRYGEERPKAVKDVTRATFFSNGKDLYFLDNRGIAKLDPANQSVKRIELKYKYDKALRDEFNQMFYEAWAQIDQNFYDVKFHGLDWNERREYYASFLPEVRTRENIRTLINDMLGDLNSSHLGFSSRGQEERLPYSVYNHETGILFRNDKPYVVERLLKDSPADKLGLDVKAGDILVAVNGVTVDQKENRERYFTLPIQKEELTLRFSRAGKEFDIKTKTTPSLSSLFYAEWEENCKEMVEKEGEGRIGYIHMRDMGVGSLNSFYVDMFTDVVHKDALILDLRYNNGGNVHNDVIDFLKQQMHFTWAYRDFDKHSHPKLTPADKPLVVLINERSLSDAEVTSNGIQQLQMAKLIGTETYRWIIFTSSVGMVDGSSSRMPAWGCYSVKGEDLEFTGVKPDIYVKNTFTDRLEGKDPQLERAIEEIKNTLNR